MKDFDGNYGASVKMDLDNEYQRVDNVMIMGNELRERCL